MKKYIAYILLVSTINHSKKISISIVTTILLFQYSCTSNHRLTPDSGSNSKSIKPEWVISNPKDDSFWYGVGISKLELEDYREISRQNALTEIAEQLKVEITSRMVNTRQETNLDYNEFFESVKEVRVNANLDYIEYVDTYQDNKYQYTLSRLNKEKYYQQLNMKKEIAATKAKNLIDKSINEMSANSLSNISLAIEAVTPYLDLFPKMKSPTKPGNEESIIIVAEKLIRDYNDQIELKFSPSTIEAMSFINDEIKVGITAVNKNTSKKVSNVRVNIRLNDEPNDDFVLTDNTGKANYQLDRLKASAGNHALIFTLDFNTMMSEDALSMVNVIPKEYSLEIALKAPRIYFDGNVVNLDKKVSNSPIIASLKECFEDNYSSTFVASKRKADLILRLNVSTEERAARMGDNYPYFVYATGSVKLKNRSTGEEILNSIFKDAKGADFSSQEKAGMNALKKLSQNMNIDICQ